MGLRTDIKKVVLKNTNIKRINSVHIQPRREITPNKRFKIMIIEVWERIK